MVSMTNLSAYHGSAASADRLKKRHAAEWRLKVYGILAILLAALALVALLSSIVGKATSALTEHYITLPVDLASDKIDPNDIKRADFGGLTKDVLKASFPNVKDRKAKKQLYDLVSSGAGFELRETVINSPGMIGQDVEFAFLASDVADLYLKGSYGTPRPVATSGALTLTEDGKDIVVRSSSNDFEAALTSVKEGLVERAELVRRQADLQQNGVREFERRLTVAETDEDKAAAQAQIDSRTQAYQKLIAEADDLIDRSKAEGGQEKIGRKEPSLLLRVGDGWIKMSEVGSDGGRGKMISPFEINDVIPAGDWSYFVMDQPEVSRKVSDNQVVWLETLRDQGAVEQVFNKRFFVTGDSREPELAGLWGAIVGSFWTMLVTFTISFPIGVLTAIYLEEFAPKTRFTDLIEVNINNLAAVPSIIFGLLGLSVFLGFFGMPRSAPLVGGLVLALMTLPTIIISSRAAIRAVPPSIRNAALGLGASKVQASFHHVLPLAMPGILTGTILGMAQALGETAPLIMIGMVAFIVDIPGGVTDSASVLPVQIFRWADFPERAFEARTALSICVLLLFLIAMNALAVFLRKRFERRW